jgi:hypothetical protein
MALGLVPRALSPSNQPPSFRIWVPAFAGMSGIWICTRRSASKLPRFQRPELSRPNLSPLSKQPVSLTHLVAGKGRMASDRCGGEERSSGVLSGFGWEATETEGEGRKLAHRDLHAGKVPPVVGFAPVLVALTPASELKRCTDPAGNKPGGVKGGKGPRAPALRITVARSVWLRRNGTHTSILRTSSGAPRPFPITSARNRVSLRSRVR